MVFTLAALIALAAPLDAREFFPLQPGVEWQYEVVEGKQRTMTTDLALSPVKLGSETATPVVTSSGGRELDRRFFVADQQQVRLVAFDANRPLPDPYAVLKVGEGTVEWTYQGATILLGGPASMQMEGTSRRRGTVEFEGRKVDALEVVLEAKIGGDRGTLLESKQVSTYGRGIGLIKMTESRNVGIGKRKQRSTMETRLVRFTAPSRATNDPLEVSP